MNTLCLALLFCAAGPPPWIAAVAVRTEHVVREERGTLHQGGSGTILAPDAKGFYVLTVRHNFLTSDGKVAKGELFVRLGKKNYPAKMVRHDAGHDLALLRVDTKDAVKGASLAAFTDFPEGVVVCKYGFPKWKAEYAEGVTLRDRIRTTQGNVEAAVKMASSVGDSGSGLFRVKDKKLIGVVRGGNPEFVEIIMPADVKKFLHKAAPKVFKE